MLLHLTRGRKSRPLDVRHPGFFLLRVCISRLRPELPAKLDRTRLPSHDCLVGFGTRLGSCRDLSQEIVCFRRWRQQGEEHVKPRIPTLTPPPQPSSLMGRDRSRSPPDDDRRRERRRDRSRDRGGSYRGRSRSRSKDRDRKDGDRDRDRESSRRKHRSRSRDGEQSRKR